MQQRRTGLFGQSGVSLRASCDDSAVDRRQVEFARNPARWPAVNICDTRYAANMCL